MGHHIQDEHGRYVFEAVKFRHKDPLNHEGAVAEREHIFYIEADDYPEATKRMRQKYQKLLEDPEWQNGEVEVYSGVWKKITPQIAA